MPTQASAKHYFDTWVSQGKVAGIGVEARRGGKHLFSYIGGSAEPCQPETQVPDETTRFDVGSVTKPVTGALLFKLIEAGELVLTDPVRRHIPEFPFEDTTVGHLLTHTAGFDEMQNLMRPQNAGEMPKFLKDIYATDKRKYPLGEQAAYWSNGYVIALDIIQRISGEPIEKFARRMLLDPLGMTHSTFDLATLDPGQWMPLWDGKRVMKKNPASPPMGDTGLMTTASDLVRVGELFLNGGTHNGRQIFAEATVNAMTRECTQGRFNKTPIFFYRGERDTYLCFGDLTSPRAMAHTGYTGSMLLVDPAYELALAVTTNTIPLHEDWRNYGRIADLMLAL